MRSPRSRAVRAAAAACAATTVTALLALSAPAYADPDPSGEPTATEQPAPAETSDPDVKPLATGADLSVKVRSSESTPNEGDSTMSKMISVEVRNKGPEAAKDPLVEFAIEGYDPADGYTLRGAGKFCDSDPVDGETVWTCRLGEPGFVLDAGAVSNRALLELVHDIDVEGDVVEGVVSVKAEIADPDEKNNSQPFTVSVVNAGVDVSAYIGGDLTIDPGKTGSFFGDGFVSIYNEGNTPVKGISLSLTLPSYAAFEKDYSNCQYSEDGRKANCSYPDATLSGNQDWIEFAAETPWRISLAANAPGPLSLGDATATAAALGVLAPQALRGAGGGQFMTKAEAPVDSAPGDNSVAFAVFSTTNPADVTVTATEAEGKVGATVSVVVAVGNKGPADSPGGTEVTFTAPKGTSVVSAPKDCKEQSKGVWVCDTDATIPVAKENKGTFKLKIDSEDVEDGKAEVVGRFTDTDDKNNSAKVVVSVLSGGGGGLPVTGQNLTIAGIAAAALLAVGGALILLGRRRRTAAAEGPADGSAGDGAAGDGAAGGASDAEAKLAGTVAEANLKLAEDVSDAEADIAKTEQAAATDADADTRAAAKADAEAARAEVEEAAVEAKTDIDTAATDATAATTDGADGTDDSAGAEGTEPKAADDAADADADADGTADGSKDDGEAGSADTKPKKK
ncbi:hypothetical protein AB0I28_06860 [Phytomonospora sp. NPDC050363]|uniref:hypothetical protein n=1 Tax=Phytomonospora sp. NPDC050363 TaxID=3155642 RepID=UPI00340EDA42